MHTHTHRAFANWCNYRPENLHILEMVSMTETLGQLGFLGDSMCSIVHPARSSSRAACEKRARSYASDRSTKDERGKRNVCHVIEVQHATKRLSATVTSRSSSHCHSSVSQSDRRRRARERSAKTSTIWLICRELERD